MALPQGPNQRWSLDFADNNNFALDKVSAFLGGTADSDFGSCSARNIFDLPDQASFGAPSGRVGRVSQNQED
jgi:hypothetical protein